mgnify:CR=1 FL=1
MKMRNVKRWLASLLCVAMLFSTLSVFGTVPKAKAAGYDGAAAAKWAGQNYRGNYGKCAEFVSNCLKHGGIDNVYETYVGELYYKLKETGLFTEYRMTLRGKRIHANDAENVGKISEGDILIVHNLRDNSKSGYAHTSIVQVIEGDRVYIAQRNPPMAKGVQYADYQNFKTFDDKGIPYEIICMHYNGQVPPPPPPTCTCSTAYAGWYQETGSGGANVNSRHSKNWGDKVGVIAKGEYVYVSKATGTGSGNLGHIMYNGEERYIAMGLFKRVNDRTGEPVTAQDTCIGKEGGVSLTGWAFDWDDPYAALKITVYLDGEFAYQGTANVERADVNRNVSGDIGDNHGYNLWVPTDKTGDHSYSVWASNVGAGNDKCIASGTVNIPAGDKDGPVISDVKVTNVTNKGYDVSCKVTDPSGVDRVMFPTWTTANGQDDLLSDWSTNAKARGTQNGDTWTFHVDIADHNNEGGEYCTDIHAYDKHGNASSLGAPRISVDTKAPVISNVKVSNITAEGYDVSCTVTDNVGVNRVMFPTWTTANGQDDLLSDWSTNAKARGTRNGNTWTFHVNIADHNNERGAYLTHIYAYDDAGNRSAVTSEIGQIIVPELNPTITFDACGGKVEFNEKQLERNADGMHYGVLPEAWMDGYVFDGWYTAIIDGARVSRTTAYTAKGNTTLYAHWTPVASDAEQGWSLQDGTLVISAVGAMQDFTSAAQTPWFKDRADIRKVVVQRGVTTVGDYAFYGCENLTSVTLPDTVTQIGKLAFYGCKDLRTLTVPDSVLTVEDYAFAKAGLQSIVFRGSAPVLGAGIFAGLNAEVRYPAAAAGWTEEVRQSYTGSVSWLSVGAAVLAAEESDLQLEDPVLASLLADSCV